MVIDKGYKKSVMGVIPEDWHVKEFADVMEGFSSGQTPYRAVAEYYKGEIPWITSGELNYNVITDTIEKITIEGAREANLKMIPKGTFLFAITGLEAAGTRGSCAITGIEATTNQSCMALYPKRGLLITPYLYHFYVRYGNELAFKYCQGTKQQSYTGGIAKKLPIIVPPTIEEQTAIATALSNIDELISQTEKLIDKKKAIKQGVTQELLKPKEGWVTKKMGNVFEIEKGTQLNRSTLDSSSEFPVYNGGIAPSGFTSSYNTDENTIIISEGGNSCGYVNYIKTKFWKGGHCYEIKPNNYLNKHFAYCLLKYNEAEIMALRVGSGLPNIQKSNLAKYHIKFPDLNKQLLISEILIDLQDSFDLLNVKLQKLKLQKQAMMQALLTGKIRLQ
jgi:type I restriction enzyme S subunit